MMIDTHGNVTERRCAKTATGLMDIWLEKAFLVYIPNLAAEPVNLQKFMILAPVSIARV